MSSPASFKGHPFHPIIIPLPIGLWIFSIVSDFIFKFGWGGEVWNEFRAASPDFIGNHPLPGDLVVLINRLSMPALQQRIAVWSWLPDCWATLFVVALVIPLMVVDSDCPLPTPDWPIDL